MRICLLGSGFHAFNSRFDIKHIRDDLHQAGLKDPPVHELAKTLNRLIITFNGTDFKKMVVRSTKTGVINLSQNLRNDQIDTKLTALLTKSSPSALFGKFTDLTGETEI